MRKADRSCLGSTIFNVFSKRANRDALRSMLFQILHQGLSFLSWMKEKDIPKVSETLLFSQD